MRGKARTFCVAVGAIVVMAIARLGAAGEPVPLIDAVRRQDAGAVRALLEKHVDVNGRQGDGATALHWAVHLDDLATTDALIRAGARVSAANDLGATPLYLACTNRNPALVDRLLAAGADANATLVNGETVLMNCARTGNGAAVAALLARGADPNRKEMAHDQTGLMWAASQKHPEATRALLAVGADVRARSRRYEQTVTSEVTQRAGREELNYTVPRGGMTALLFAARSGDAESVRLLAAAGADVDDAQADGLTALGLAAYSGQGAAGIALLDLGANPNVATIGYTALHAAVLRADLGLVRALLAHGANPNAEITIGTPMRRTSQDYDLPATLLGATPYLLAAKFLEVDLMRELARGANPRLPLNGRGVTPLMVAVGMASAAPLDRRGVSTIDGGRIEDETMVLAAVSAALELGSDVNAANGSGETALHAAASFGYGRVIQRLVEDGANVNARTGRGQTPLTILQGRRDGDGRERVVALLRQHGATD